VSPDDRQALRDQPITRSPHLHDQAPAPEI
jgi:hypothetical protein